ncbi:MAG: CBS domain-containing protein [Deltaproteobacteria bacterium]|nr:CBS domain-containing protein [Deltaproteobacteria bacterium]
MLTCEEVMKKPLVTVTEKDDLGLAVALLQHHGFRHLPVLRERRLVGLLTQTDLWRAKHDLGAASITPVCDAMVTTVKTVRRRTPVRHAARLMMANHVSCLPVVEEDGTLVGLLTASDLVELAAELAEELDREDIEICRG